MSKVDATLLKCFTINFGCHNIETGVCHGVWMSVLQRRQMPQQLARKMPHVLNRNLDAGCNHLMQVKFVVVILYV